MNVNYRRVHLIMTVTVLFISQLVLQASTSIEMSLQTAQKCTIQDSITIDMLVAQLPTASPIQRTKTIRSLQKFGYDHFTEHHKNQIEAYLNNNKIPSKELILLSGFLQMEATLLGLVEKHRDNKPLVQYINIALVRAGNIPKAKTLRKNIEKITVNDAFVYEVLSLLTYTKQPIIYDWLLDQIESDEKNCHPADAEGSGNINCAYRIMEAVAPNIIDFPIQVDSWGDLAVDSYSKALLTVREWIAANENNYILDKKTY